LAIKKHIFARAVFMVTVLAMLTAALASCKTIKKLKEVIGLGGSDGLSGGGITTFAVFGLDEGQTNTDVIMVCTLDAAANTLDIVSIPRDTLVNISGANRKANNIFVKRSGEDATDRAKRVLGRDLKNLLGYEPDFFVAFKMSGFKKIIDAVGGIEFDVPQDMNYEDPAQGLSIHIGKGLQTLTGEEALKVLRFRNTYVEGDIKRVRVQQDFLAAAAKQILGSRVKDLAPAVIEILLSGDVVSAAGGNDYGSLTTNNLTYLADQFAELNASGVTFTMLPGNTTDSVKGNSYVTIYVDEWLEVINTKLKQDITKSDLSVLTRGESGKLYVTDGDWVGSEW